MPGVAEKRSPLGKFGPCLDLVWSWQEDTISLVLGAFPSWVVRPAPHQLMGQLQ